MSDRVGRTDGHDEPHQWQLKNWNEIRVELETWSDEAIRRELLLEPDRIFQTVATNVLKRRAKPRNKSNK